MARVLLLQLDGKMPNLALMRLAGHHRQRGDMVYLWQAPTVRRVEQMAGQVERGLWDNWDQIYASLIFERTRPVAQRLKQVFPAALIGGTGWDYATTLEQHGVVAPPDYSVYPKFRQSLGFTQRGCRLKCNFCVVPRKEGAVRQEATIWDIWRGEPWPREIILLDNDFFGQENWRDRIRELREGRFKVSFNQGINARMLSDEAAEAIASVDYRAAGMKYRQVCTAWDSRPDEEVLFRGLRRLVSHGVSPGNIMVYMLVGYWPGESEEDWLYRQGKLRAFGAQVYPMPYVRNHLTVGFQRWVIAGYDKRIAWSDWKQAECEPRKLGRQEQRRIDLPLFAGHESEACQ